MKSEGEDRACVAAVTIYGHYRLDRQNHSSYTSTEKNNIL